ncbi:MAG TPA: hypothetical protein EYG67_05470 [Campylobacterales bacterium]|nr:hypothetical protein [Campylobacterales bacterium]HIP41787.1 hypothetical protein [Campylobacterales bacterium]
MLKKISIMGLLLSGVLCASSDQPNYDNYFDAEDMKEIPADIEMVETVEVEIEPDLSAVKLESLVFQEKIELDKSGKKVKKNVPVKQVIRGTKVVYINRLINHDAEAKINLVVKNPIPKGTEYVINSARCYGECSIGYSTDGGQSFSLENHIGEHYTDLEFYFKTLSSKQEMRMGFRAIVK